MVRRLVGQPGAEGPHLCRNTLAAGISPGTCPKRRMDLGLVQQDAAAEIGVCVKTIRDWEHGRKPPRKRYGPAIRVFLGASPLPSGHSLPDRLRFIRWTLGLTQEDLATRLRVNRCTVSAWEAGRDSPNRANRQAIEATMRAAARPSQHTSAHRSIPPPRASRVGLLSGSVALLD